MSTKPVAHFPVRSSGQGVQLSLISTTKGARSNRAKRLLALFYAFALCWISHWFDGFGSSSGSIELEIERFGIENMVL
jgi:hypothetical protein